MDTIGIILGILIFVNFVFSIHNKNYNAACGWFVAGLEWCRRLL